MVYLLNRRVLLLTIIDICFINFAYIAAFYVLSDAPFMYGKFLLSSVVFTFIHVICFHLFGLYRNLWKQAGPDEFLMLAAGCVAGGLLSLLFSLLFNLGIPANVILQCSLINLLFLAGSRCSIKIFYRLLPKSETLDKHLAKKVLVVGAGSAGAMVIKEMKEHPELGYLPVGLIDDNLNKIGTSVSGVRVLGNRNRIKAIVKESNIDEIIIAIPSLTGKSRVELVDLCCSSGCRTKIVPGIKELVEIGNNLHQVRDVDVEDLLDRETIALNNEDIIQYIKGKTVMVTGGGGSIGSELCRQIVLYQPKELLILDIYENGAYDIYNELKMKKVTIPVTVIIASVTDRKALETIFCRYCPSVVFHAAAHKHVPLMEANPTEAVKNNVFGTVNAVECADMAGTQKFVLISTDKAVNPTNVMGTTKRICEMIIQTMNNYSCTEFVAVRFGNVLGSNGSVIPLFKEQIKNGGPVTVTDKNVTRYFMTIREAAQLVLQAGAYARGGEIFVLDMGKPVKIYDLACKLIKLSGFEPDKDIKIEITGLRPGEKLYEELLMVEEGLEKTQHEKIFVGRPIKVDPETLQRKLLELKNITDENDTGRLLEKIEEIVPTYNRHYNGGAHADQRSESTEAEKECRLVAVTLDN